MQIINEEEDMKISELMKVVYEWAKQYEKPFTSGIAYEYIEDADDIKSVSDAIGNLYRAGKLARKRIDKVRFSYALPEHAPDGYESISPKKDERLEEAPIHPEKPVVSLPPASDQAEAPFIIKTTPPKAIIAAAIPDPVIKEKIDQARTSHSRKKSSSEAHADDLSPFVASEIGAVQLPDSFTLTLQTANGLIITIQCGA